MVEKFLNIVLVPKLHQKTLTFLKNHFGSIELFHFRAFALKQKKRLKIF